MLRKQFKFTKLLRLYSANRRTYITKEPIISIMDFYTTFTSFLKVNPCFHSSTPVPMIGSVLKCPTLCRLCLSEQTGGAWVNHSNVAASCDFDTDLKSKNSDARD